MLMRPMLIFSLAVFLVPKLGYGQKDYSTAIENSQKQIQSILDEYPGVSVAVGVGDEIIWNQGFGYANANTEEQVTPDHRFLYYSLSKSILGMALYDLMLKGLIDLDKPITFYDDTLPDQYDQVNVRNLLNHSAGIRHYNKGEWMKLSTQNCGSPSEAIQTFINDPLESKPGTEVKYSSFGYVLLSHLIVKVTHTPFDDFFHQNVFEPIGLSSIERVQGSDLASNQAVRYDKWNRKKLSGKETTVDNSCKFGGGGFIGTAEDLALLHMTRLKKEKSNPNSFLYKTLNPDLRTYAFGLGVNKTETSGYTYYVHTGSGKGGSSVLLIYPAFDLTIVLLGNIKGDGITEIIGSIGNGFIADILEK